MADASQRRGRWRGGGTARPRGWCCSFAGVPPSPDHRSLPSAASVPAAASPAAGGGGGGGGRKLPPKSPSSLSSFQGSPASSRLAGLGGLIDPRRILSPGRVSPIDPDESFPLPPPSPLSLPTPPPVEEDVEDLVPTEQAAPASAVVPLVSVREDDGGNEAMDLRLSLRGRDGRCLTMELESGVLYGSSAFFADMAPGVGFNSSGGGASGKRIEVDGVENVEAFRTAVELMYQPEPVRWLATAGVSRAIDVLEVSSSIMFDNGIKACLTYIEAAPWNESEEEKLKNLFARCTFDEAISQDVLARLRPNSCISSEDLIVHLIQSVTSSTNSGARKDMQSLVNGLLSKSSLYQKDFAGLNKESIYQICRSYFGKLVDLFEEATESANHTAQLSLATQSKPVIERISLQTENLYWLFEILVNNDMAEEFVELWAMQDRLIVMHPQASPMIRYELSRISASVFIALGKGRVQCRGDLRSLLFYGWFGPMLLDFGWLQRCSKGLDVRSLEENIGQALLTLPLKQQQFMFEEWFQCFASRGADCPNLTRSFQVWWRRSFVRSSVETRR
uniref:Uncharacterized protein n=1 Tax=Avena sativa TaxID=4498 RepID=A0ACD5V8I0_AVESA